MAVAHFVGFASHLNDTWGSASLDPRRYAIASLRGLNKKLFTDLFVDS
jgi:hypothetical protein